MCFTFRIHDNDTLGKLSERKIAPDAAM